MIQLITCDLDGTLLNPDTSIRLHSAHVLRQLSDQGILVVLATGRSWRTALRIQKEIGISGPLIAHNGAYIYDSRTGQDWYRHSIPVKRTREFLHFANEHHFMLRCYLGANKPVLFNRFNDEHRQNWLRPEDQCLPDAGESLAVEPLEIFLFGNEEVDILIEQFGVLTHDYELTIFTHKGYREVNICAPHVDKIEAIRALSEHLKITTESMLSIGDGLNDVLMLKATGTSIAIGDGEEAAIRVAHHVTPLHHPEPVLEGIQWAFRQGLFSPQVTLEKKLAQ